MSEFKLNYNVRESAPTLAEFHKSDHAFKLIVGPVGSGKSTACCMEILHRCMEQETCRDRFRRSKWLVMNSTRHGLDHHTLPTWLDWLPSNVGLGNYDMDSRTYYLEFDDIRAEIIFRAFDTQEDIADVLNLEVTGAWLNDCSNISQYKHEIIEGRICRFPQRFLGNVTYSTVIADMNMPEIGTYWWRVAGGKPIDDCDDIVVDCAVFAQPSGLSDRAENVKNLPDGYYDRISCGKSSAWVNRFIHSKDMYL